MQSIYCKSGLRKAIFALAVSFGVAFAVAAPSAHAVDNPSLESIIAGAHRSDVNRARNVYRHPVETLTFFGVHADSKIVEISPGGGWYTEVLAPYVRDRGLYVAAIPANSSRARKNFEDKLTSNPELYNKAAIMPLGAPDSLNIRPEGGADVVLTFRNVHNWLDNNLVDAYFASFFAALKTGGVLGVVEHRAKPGTTLAQSKESGYMTEEYVIARAMAAGFKLDGRSEINANPKDSKDYADGVWTLPPTLAKKNVDREKYLAIGESDRMTLRFVKPPSAK